MCGVCARARMCIVVQAQVREEPAQAPLCCGTRADNLWCGSRAANTCTPCRTKIYTHADASARTRTNTHTHARTHASPMSWYCGSQETPTGRHVLERFLPEKGRGQNKPRVRGAHVNIWYLRVAPTCYTHTQSNTHSYMHTHTQAHQEPRRSPWRAQNE